MHQTNNARFLDLLWRHVVSLGLLTVAFLVCYSRYGTLRPCTPGKGPPGPQRGPALSWVLGSGTPWPPLQTC